MSLFSLLTRLKWLIFIINFLFNYYDSALVHFIHNNYNLCIKSDCPAGSIVIDEIDQDNLNAIILGSRAGFRELWLSELEIWSHDSFGHYKFLQGFAFTSFKARGHQIQEISFPIKLASLRVLHSTDEVKIEPKEWTLDRESVLRH